MLAHAKLPSYHTTGICTCEVSFSFGIIFAFFEREVAMKNQRQAIAERLKGLRDAFDLTREDVASKTGIDIDVYARYEDGSLDVPISTITILASLFGIDPSSILTGCDPHAKVMRVTRKGCGALVERGGVYQYEGLSVLFAGKKMEPFIVTIDPSQKKLNLNHHPGQEFNYMLSGSMSLTVDGQTAVLNEGDCVYFDASKPHGMVAEGDKPVKFLAIITA